ncbi:MAG: RNA-binding S4 domain-containing protein [Erysipelotrichaceae bacterium]|nr:RNA-binding S4 domain-containing protein [Erysipelotrichaceae bacterium]
MVKIKIYSEPITLGQFVKFLGLIYSGGEVKKFLEENDIFVNEVSEKRRGKKLFSGDLVQINDQKYVLKIENDY